MKITKAIIPAAGYGTRFLPYTKTIPKEMLPLLNMPSIHTIVQEGIDSAIKHIVFISNKEKVALNNYFNEAPLLEKFLKRQNKEHFLSSISDLIRQLQFSFIEQREPKGLGHAILTARPVIKDDYFGIMLPDDIIKHTKPALAQLLEVAHEHKASVIAIQEVPPHMVSSYGVISIKKQLSDRLYEIDDLVEKPSPASAPSNLAIIGRYVLSSSIFPALEKTSPSHAGEVQLTDGIAHMIHEQGQSVLAYKMEGDRYDIGIPTGWIKATIELALKHPEYGTEIKEFIQSHVYSSLTECAHHKFCACPK